LVHFCSNYAEKLTAHMRANPNDDKPFRVDIPGPKGNRNVRPFYCFIGHDALASLREYFDRGRGFPAPGEPVWIFPKSQRGMVKADTFTQNWLGLLRRAKLIPKKDGKLTSRYGYNAHNTR